MYTQNEVPSSSGLNFIACKDRQTDRHTDRNSDPTEMITHPHPQFGFQKVTRVEN